MQPALLGEVEGDASLAMCTVIEGEVAARSPPTVSNLMVKWTRYVQFAFKHCETASTRRSLNIASVFLTTMDDAQHPRCAICCFVVVTE